ncbi:hypothetical protein Acr_07g0012100 [Actinidia rufa]|uniref:Uncharacterized protein n=1 Tax=Actinidia rufa TaxID=165716 RepID=A0A7J0EX15_9ERIC|nr:hypothetical protein Acr_07g0012100 [Actinidia rufa]
MMAEDESDVLLAVSVDGKSDCVLDSGSTFHLCIDREVFSTCAACDGLVRMANNMANRVVDKGTVRFRMADGRSLTLIEFSRKIRRCYGERRLEGSIQTRGTTVRHGPVVLARRMGKKSNRSIEARKASTEDVQSEAQRKETKKSYTATGPTTLKRVSFALDLISGGDLSSCAHKRGEIESRKLAKYYGGAGPETVKIDNLKISDYPLVGWRGRLLSQAHLDEFKPTWLSSSSVDKISESFQSVADYFGAFVFPLLEETRAELASSMDVIHGAPFAEVISLDESKPHGTSLYDVKVDYWKNKFSDRDKEPYKTLPGDIFIISDAKPENVSDLQRVGRTWTWALVTKIPEDENEGDNSSTHFKVKACRDIEVKDGMRQSLFVTFLINI